MSKKNCIHEIKSLNGDKVTFILLCAQKSNRRGYNNVALSDVHNQKKVIDLQIECINKAHPNNEIILISGFEHEKVVQYVHKNKYQNVRIAENKNYEKTSALDGWKIGLNLSIPGNTYIIHGDRIFSSSMISDENHEQGTHTYTHNIDKTNYDLGLLIENNKLINISYGLPNVWSEIFFIHADDFQITRKLINETRRRKIYSIDSFINLISRQFQIKVIEKHSNEVYTFKDL